MPSIKKAVWEKALKTIEELTREKRELFEELETVKEWYTREKKGNDARRSREVKTWEGLRTALRLAKPDLCTCKIAGMTNDQMLERLHDSINCMQEALADTKKELEYSQLQMRSVAEQALHRFLEKPSR